MAELTLGLRNNNPLNIKDGRSNWIGRVGRNKGFVVFNSMEHGMRAALYLLRKYVLQYHIRGFDDIIKRWCPDSTAESYIASVRSELNKMSVLPQATRFCVVTDIDLYLLAYAMTIVECGPSPDVSFLPYSPYYISDWRQVYDRYFRPFEIE